MLEIAAQLNNEDTSDEKYNKLPRAISEILIRYPANALW